MECAPSGGDPTLGVGARLFLGSRTYVIDPEFRSADMNIKIAIGLGDAAVFGFFFKPILGQSLVVDVVMRKEPLE